MWWRENSLLAVAMDGGTRECRSDHARVCEEGRESILQFSLLVDRESKCIEVKKWLVLCYL